jgi:hypothetical protein
VTLRARLRLFSLLLVLFSSREGFSQPSTAVRTSWIDGGSYRFGLDGIRGCGPASFLANTSTDFRDAAPSLGFLVRIEARTPAFFVSPRDLTLEADGVILDPTLALPERRWRCAPLLTFTRLAPGRVAQGYVLFRVPEAFRASKGPILLSYRPTRWGGAKRVVAQIQKCLNACLTTVPRAPHNQSPARQK